MTPETQSNSTQHSLSATPVQTRWAIKGYLISLVVIMVLLFGFGSTQAQEVTQPDLPSTADLKQQLKSDIFSQPTIDWQTGGADTADVTPAAVDEAATSLATRLGFQSYRDNAWMIYYAAEDGAGQTPFVAVGSNARPKAHPWKSGFLYAAGASGQLDVFYTELGVVTQQLTSAAGNDLMPAWNQNGDRVVFVSDRDGLVDLWVMNANGSGQAKLTNDGATDLTPAWSPDGRKIVWVKVGAGGNALWTMNPDGSDARPITPELSFLESPTWSPDSSRIAFSMDGDGDVWSEIWLINADGTGAHAVYDAAVDLVDAVVGTWSNDGNWLLFTRIDYVVYNQQLYLNDAFIERVSSQGGASQRLTATGRDLYPDIRGLDTVPPVVWFAPLPTYSRTWTTVLHWGGADAMSGIASTSLSVNDQTVSAADSLPGLVPTYLLAGNQPSGALQSTSMAAGELSKDFVTVYGGIPGATQTFKASVADQAGNLGQSPTVSTTFYDSIYRGQITDNRGIPVPERPVSFSHVAWDNGVSAIANFGDTKTNNSGQFRAVLGGVTDTSRLNEPNPAAVPLGIWWEEGMGREGLPEITLYESHSTNYIENGSFEEGDAGWQFTGDALVPETSPLHHRGKNAASMGTGPCPSLVCFAPATALDSGNESDIVMEADGTIHVVLISRKAGAQGVYYLTKPAQAGWSTAIKIADGLAYVPAVTVDGQGNLYAMWHTDANRLWFVSKPHNGAWTAPVDLGAGSYPDIAVDTVGALHIVYDQALPCSGYCNIGLYYQQRTPQGVWQSPVLLDIQYKTGSFRAAVEIDSDATAHIAWIERPAVNEVGWLLSNGTYLLYRSRSKAGEWSKMDLLLDQSSASSRNLNQLRVDVSLDKHNQPMLYATGGPEVWLYSKDDNGNWARGDYDQAHFFADRAGGPSGLTHHLAYLPEINEYTQYAAYLDYELTTHRGENLPSWRLLDSIFSQGADGEPSLEMLVDPQGRPIGFYNDLRDPNNPRLRQMVAKTASSSSDGAIFKTLIVPDVPNPTLAFSYLMLAGMPTDQSSLSVTVRQGITDTVAFSTTQATANWTLGWVDLSPWLGQEVTITFTQRQAAGEPFVHVYLDDITLSAWRTPVAERISPDALDPGVSVAITVTGQNFLDGVNVRLTRGDQIVSRVTLSRLDEQTLTVDLPALGPGLYDLWVINPGGQQSVRVGAIRVGKQSFLPSVAK